MSDRPKDLNRYVEQMALVLDLPLQPEHQAGVVDNLARMKAIAQFVNEFPLPEEIEAAPIFQP